MEKTIKEALRIKGMTQKELAEEMYVTPQAVSKWVNGQSNPGIDNVARLYEILGIDLLKELVDRNNRRKGRIEMKHSNIDELDTFDKCIKEAVQLLESSGVKNKYSCPVITLLEWLLPAIIVLTRHQQIKEGCKGDIGYETIHYNLMDYLETDCPNKVVGLYENYLEYNIYLMGGDLFESFEPYRMQDHDLVNQAMSKWYKFQKALIKSEASPVYCELLVAITDLADYVLGVA